MTPYRLAMASFLRNLGCTYPLSLPRSILPQYRIERLILRKAQLLGLASAKQGKSLLLDSGDSVGNIAI